MRKNRPEGSYQLEDTIAAISTPLGEGGIGVVRISGKEAFKVADMIFKGKLPPSKIESHTVNHGEIIDADHINLSVSFMVAETP